MEGFNNPKDSQHWWPTKEVITLAKTIGATLNGLRHYEGSQE